MTIFLLNAIKLQELARTRYDWWPQEAMSIWNGSKCRSKLVLHSHLCKKEATACAQTLLLIQQSGNSKKYSELFNSTACSWKHSSQDSFQLATRNHLRKTKCYFIIWLHNYCYHKSVCLTVMMKTSQIFFWRVKRNDTVRNVLKKK